MSYTVKHIYEADYGCEERPTGYKPKDIVILTDDFCAEIRLELPDEELVAKGINEGDRVMLDGNNDISKA